MSIDLGHHTVPQEANAFFSFVKRSNNDVFIFGADIAGKVVKRLLDKSDLKVSGFIDNNRNKCAEAIDNIPVFHAESLNQLDKNSVILIASTYIDDAISQQDTQFLYWAPITLLLNITSR